LQNGVDGVLREARDIRANARENCFLNGRQEIKLVLLGVAGTLLVIVCLPENRGASSLCLPGQVNGGCAWLTSLMDSAEHEPGRRLPAGNLRDGKLIRVNQK
jgi:hypothetical protein